MTRFIEKALADAGLAEVLAARRRGDVASVPALLQGKTLDLLVLGALADTIRAAENGAVVRVHERATAGVAWIAKAASELDLLRAVALARIASPIGARIGIDWGESGLEVAQVALGFGATDLTGPITRKSGSLIHEGDLRKVKGKGMVSASSLKRGEIAALVRNAGRECEFSEALSSSSPESEVAHA